MSLNNILNQFMGSQAAPSGQEPGQGNSGGGFGQTVSNLASNIPGGLVGGAAAGGAMALLMGNKSARKFAGKAATYGGAAVLGGLAFKAFQNWQGNKPDAGATATPQQQAVDPASFHQKAISQQANPGINPELVLIKAMVAAAKADGHMDADEQQKIFKAVETTGLSASEKGLIFEFLQNEIPIFDITTGINCIEMKAEVYLASCLVITLDHPAERAHLDNLAMALQLPAELAQQLEQQAHQAITEST
jgi:uncharacterized membrane protein YebE (DUF533 family)